MTEALVAEAAYLPESLDELGASNCLPVCLIAHITVRAGHVIGIRQWMATGERFQDQ